MVLRMKIFRFIFMILVFQKKGTSADISNTTEEVYTQNASLPETPTSPNTEAPPIFPLNGAGGKPTISLNETVEKPNLLDIKNELNKKDDTKDTTTKLPRVEVNVTVDTHETTDGNIIPSTPNQVNSTQKPNIETDSNVSSREKPDQVIERNHSQPEDTEVKDLLEVPKEIYHLEPASPNITHEPNQDVNLSVLLFDKLLQTEDSLRNHSDHQSENAGIIQGKLAAILAGVFLVVSIFGYISLLSWRRFLEHRYGNREMLVNEEEFYTDDLGHFSI